VRQSRHAITRTDSISLRLQLLHHPAIESFGIDMQTAIYEVQRQHVHVFPDAIDKDMRKCPIHPCPDVINI
jgi:hypothetical protein